MANQRSHRSARKGSPSPQESPGSSCVGSPAPTLLNAEVLCDLLGGAVVARSLLHVLHDHIVTPGLDSTHSPLGTCSGGAEQRQWGSSQAGEGRVGGSQRQASAGDERSRNPAPPLPVRRCIIGTVFPGQSDDVIAEFHAALNDAAGVFGIARNGLRPTAAVLRHATAEAGLGPDDLVHLTLRADEGTDGPRAAFAAWQSGDLDEKLGDSGPVAMQIGHQWLIHVYHLWENDFRKRIARERGLDYRDNESNKSPRTELSNQYFADLGYMRHDILKNKGIASQKNSGRCKDLCWFDDGERILVTESHVYQFMEGFGLAYPASGRPSASDAKYRFHGLFESPAPAGVFVDARFGKILVAQTRAIDGEPVVVAAEKIRDELRGRTITLTGRNRQVEAEVVAVGSVDSDDSVLLIGMRVAPNFYEEVRSGVTQLMLRLGSEVSWQPTRTAVPVHWVRADLLLIEVTTSENQYYSLEPFQALIGAERTLVSTAGDLYRAVVVDAQYKLKDDPRVLQLYLRANPRLALAVKERTVSLRLPFIFHDS
jgi:hypothetical protein